MLRPFSLIIRLIICNHSSIIQLSLLMILFLILVIKSFKRLLQLIMINLLEHFAIRNPFMIIDFIRHLLVSLIIDSHLKFFNLNSFIDP